MRPIASYTPFSICTLSSHGNDKNVFKKLGFSSLPSPYIPFSVLVALCVPYLCFFVAIMLLASHWLIAFDFSLLLLVIVV